MRQGGNILATPSASVWTGHCGQRAFLLPRCIMRVKLYKTLQSESHKNSSARSRPQNIMQSERLYCSDPFSLPKQPVSREPVQVKAMSNWQFKRGNYLKYTIRQSAESFQTNSLCKLIQQRLTRHLKDFGGFLSPKS